MVEHLAAKLGASLDTMPAFVKDSTYSTLRWKRTCNRVEYFLRCFHTIEVHTKILVSYVTYDILNRKTPYPPFEFFRNNGQKIIFNGQWRWTILSHCSFRCHFVDCHSLKSRAVALFLKRTLSLRRLILAKFLPRHSPLTQNPGNKVRAVISLSLSIYLYPPRLSFLLH